MGWSDLQLLIEEELLPRVRKPSRYLGSEWNAVRKEWKDTPVRMAFAFPDIYEVGMSHLGLHLLYGLVNGQQDFLMERVFAPWVDMEQLMRERQLPLFSLESCRPVGEFDVVGFTLQYEMSFTNILNMLDLAGIPLKAAERDERHPLVIGGGPCAFNPEPLADFMDFVLLGDSEESLLEVLRVIQRQKANPGSRVERARVLAEVAGIPGVYVPAFYSVTYRPDGPVAGVHPNRPGVPHKVQKRVVADLDLAYFNLRPIVPFMETIHDRIMLEVMRGCTRGCRFCQAGILYRPVRERSPENLLEQAGELIRTTGHHEISLTSLSTADYTCVQSLAQKLMDAYEQAGVSISLPSLRVDAFSVGLAQQVQRVRKSGLTFAPEAGTQRLRDVINKGVTEKDLLQAVASAFAAGWKSFKLYFMIGLPTERDEDLEGIARTTRRVLESSRDALAGSRGGKVTVSMSSFVPKAHTPFQWEPQDPIPELKRKQVYLKSLLRDRRITSNYHQAELSFLEAVFAKGDRRLAPVLEKAWRLGCKFDSWSEHFRHDLWREAFSQVGIEPSYYAHRRIPVDELLPWDHLDTGVSKEFLLQEHRDAMEGKATGDCRLARCSDCGICPGMHVKMVLRGDKRHAAPESGVY